MEIQQKIEQQLGAIVGDLGVVDILPAIERPKDISHADLTTTIALVLAKKLKRAPLEIAEEIVSRFKNNLPEEVATVLAVAPGYINIELKESYVVTRVKGLLRPDAAYLEPEERKKMIVEYSSPNIAKPFTIGHLRSTVIGDAVANLLEAVGHEVYRDNHIGDWGTQFGKQIYAIKTWGNEEAIEKSDRPVKLLVELYVKFHEEAEKDPSLEDEGRAWFKKLEDGDTEARLLWKKCIDWSWKEFEAIYKELGVPSSGKSFENKGRGYGEAYFEDKMSAPLKELEEKGLLKEGKEGAKIVEFPEQTKLTPLMILKKDGASLYATRDLATDNFRRTKYGSDIVIINEVGAEQALYWQQIFQLEKMLGWYTKEQRVHIKHGMYRFKEGKMSTRKGNVIWLEDVLAEAVSRAGKLTQREIPNFELAQSFSTEDIRVNKHSEAAKQHQMTVGDMGKSINEIAMGAIKWNDLKRNSAQDINFDWDDVLSMQGNSGPYMQYVAVRCQSVLTKAGVTQNDVESWGFDTLFDMQPEEQLLLRMVSMYAEVLQLAAKEYAPHVLCTYLFELAQTFNNFYQKLPIINPSIDKIAADSSNPRNDDLEMIKKFRLFLTHATGSTITKGLQVLGIAVPEKM